jgi:hypothetical protein
MAEAATKATARVETTLIGIRRKIEGFFIGNRNIEITVDETLMDYAFAEALRQMNIRKVLLRADYKMILPEDEKDFCIQNCTKQFQVFQVTTY